MSIRKALGRILRSDPAPPIATTPAAPPDADHTPGRDDEALRACQAIGTRRTARRRNTR